EVIDPSAERIEGRRELRIGRDLNGLTSLTTSRSQCPVSIEPATRLRRRQRSIELIFRPRPATRIRARRQTHVRLRQQRDLGRAHTGTDPRRGVTVAAVLAQRITELEEPHPGVVVASLAETIPRPAEQRPSLGCERRDRALE